jgi:hypothetical protein
MSQVSRGPVVIGTGVFGAQLTRRGWPLGELHRPSFKGAVGHSMFILPG